MQYNSIEMPTSPESFMKGKKPSLQKISFSLLTNPYKNVSIIPADETARNYISRSRAAWLARRAHNPEVVGSNPSSATKEKLPHQLVWGFFFCYGVLICPFQIVSPTSVVRWGKRPTAAGGRVQGGRFGAAVEKIKDECESTRRFFRVPQEGRRLNSYRVKDKE